MSRLIFGLFCCSSALLGQSPATILNFEADQRPGSLVGWYGGEPDDKVVHGGKWSARIERADSDGFSTIGKDLPMDFGGRTIVFRGYLKTENVGGFAGLWIREDGDAPALAFDNMQNRQLKGTTDWTQYTIALPRVAEAKRLVFGALLSGKGKLWIDDLELLVDGKPIWEAPKQDLPKTVLDKDREFDGGSGLQLDALSATQIQNLATLGKVWGFLKYHHPRVAAGELHWDYELLRALPSVLAAPGATSATAAMVKWIARFGQVPACGPCASLDESEIHLRPDNAWIENEKALGAELSAALRTVYRNRPTGPQFYISLAPMVRNPEFKHEPAYAKVELPDPGFQLLGLYRFWNIIRYWFPYRDVLGENWDDVLAEFIPRAALAKSAEAYDRELMALVARAHDTHAGLSTRRDVLGKCNVAAHLRFIGNEFVVAAVADDSATLKVGDIVAAIDETPVPKVVELIGPYYSASNDAAKRFRLGSALTRGQCGSTVAIRVVRDGKPVEISAKRASEARTPMRHDLPGETFQLLSKDVAYLKLSSVKAGDAQKYIDSASTTKGLIVDIRNYPSEFVPFALGSRLMGKRTPFVQFTRGDLANPGAFYWTEPLSISPAPPHYNGKVVVLVDESTISQAEYTAMAFRAAGATVIGSTTQGADGNVSGFSFPGGATSGISGIGVFCPDKRPTQRVGIVPDIRVEPTIEGLKAGRDEVLERAIEEIVGKSNKPV